MYMLSLNASRAEGVHVSSLLQPHLETQGVKEEYVEDARLVNATSLQGLKINFVFFLFESRQNIKYIYFFIVIILIECGDKICLSTEVYLYTQYARRKSYFSVRITKLQGPIMIENGGFSTLIDFFIAIFFR